MSELSSTRWLLKEARYIYPFFSLRFVSIYNFFVTQLQYMITFKPRNQMNCNNLLLCCLIVKLIRILYKNISYGNLVFTEQLFEVGELFWNKISKKNKQKLFRNKHFVLKQWVNPALEFYSIFVPKSNVLPFFECLNAFEYWVVFSYLRPQ